MTSSRADIESERGGSVVGSGRTEESREDVPGGISAVEAVDLTIGDGELFVLVGPSGSGKSTLLRLIAGLETPTAGSLWIGDSRADRLAPCGMQRGDSVPKPTHSIPISPSLKIWRSASVPADSPNRRSRNASVSLAARLRTRGVPQPKAGDTLRGQRQRVAAPGGHSFANPACSCSTSRSHASTLRPPPRYGPRSSISIVTLESAPMIHVTHDQAEAMAMGHRIAVMDHGRVVQTGSPPDIYHR